MDRQAGSPILQIKILSPNTRPPVRATPEAAGVDLFSTELTTLNPGETKRVKTGLAIRPPWGTYCRIAPKSGLAAKRGLWINAGVIDRDFTGEVEIVMYNSGDNVLVLSPGTKMAQLICEKILLPRIQITSDLPKTNRGENKFGSTGA